LARTQGVGSELQFASRAYHINGQERAIGLVFFLEIEIKLSQRPGCVMAS
jgi:hypothetical protein